MEQKHRNSSSRQQLDTSIDVTHREKNEKGVVITGDSIIRKIYSHNLNQTTKDCLSIVKSLLGATAQDILDCTKPSIAPKSDMMILHARTYDLRSDQTPSSLSNQIIYLAKDVNGNGI